ncbi:MAG: EAL domain-containing protein [Methylotenera sp.]|uniref:bifunctional diguanylate cyclase/phosphodiesterase n=1 Tax=Methylotenera sp. TaxID=2051956 RepID=UPI00272113FC|nr:EAL domain-containing protein [Methylotenera sp.]MDO9151020.1 EAL domain-containing protein [Methylotenera sp.]
MQFKSLKSRISVIFLSLILVIQVLSSIAIKLSIDKNARLSVNQQLEVGERVFLNLLQHNGDSLSVGARILAADFGFKAAIASNDHETILSALVNHQSRINADIAIFYSPDQNSLVISENLSESEVSEKIAEVIYAAKNDIQKNNFTIFNNQPYQLVAVPVKAPLTIGWVVMGFEINNSLANTLHKLSNLEVTFISQSGASPWRSTAGTMSVDSSEKIVKYTATQPALNTNSNFELTIGEMAFGTRYVTIFKNINDSLYAVLQRSIDEATAPFQVLLLNLLILSIVGMLIFIVSILYVSRIVAQPIVELANTAKKLEEGDYSFKVDTSRKDELGKLSSAFSSMRTAIADREKSILKLAYLDEMTGLPNRASFMKELNTAIYKSEANNESLSVLVMNLDRFKQINNVLGHDFGNQLLHAVSIRISQVFRKDNDVVARISGDEFAVLLPGTDANVALNIAQKLLQAFEKPIQLDDNYVDITAGIGIASYPVHSHQIEQLLSFAEIAMQVSKVKKSGPVIFDSSFDAGSNVNLTLVSELKNSILNNELMLFVQPKIDLKSRVVTSVEALIRWKHPARGIVFPDQFIPFAEQTGLIRDITLWMIAEASKVSAQWIEKGILIPIAVNISARDLIDSDFPNKVTEILKSTGSNTSLISLEVTESSIMDDPHRAKQTLLHLSEMGIKLAIDDFGTGYSSLSYLKELPVSELKIDKSFVMNIEHNQNDRIIVSSTIELAHNMGLHVVAEGIENIKVWKFLQDMNCDYGQGYYMTKPIPVSDFETWYQEWT